VWESAERGPYPLYHADALNVLAQIERDAATLPQRLKRRRRLIAKHGATGSRSLITGDLPGRALTSTRWERLSRQICRLMMNQSTSRCLMSRSIRLICL
jgi:hypothetical protein